MEQSELAVGAKHFADALFDELSRQLQELLLCCPGSSSNAAGVSHKNAVLLFRCCVSVLPVLEFNASFVMDKCRVLMALLRSLLSRARGVDDPAASAVPPPSFVLALLEVFTENLLVHHQLRKYFAITDSASPVAEKLFAPPCCCGDLHVIPELVSCHFLLSLSNERNFEKFVNSLSWSKKAMSETPEIGLTAALVLVRTGFLFSLPNIVQAHLILLASGCINVQSSNYNCRLNAAGSDHHMLAFELSVNLYLRYLLTLGIFDKFGGMKDRPSCFAKKLPFNSCIQEATSHKLSCQKNELLSFCQSHSNDELSGNEADILNSSVSFIEENQHIIDEQFRQATNLIMKSIISNILAWTKQKTMHEANAKVSEEIICLAAVLKLMSSLLLQILCHIRQIGFADGRKKVNHAAFHKEYNFISETIRFMGQYEANQLHRHNLLDLMGEHVDRESIPMLMLAHFASLSMYSLSMRLGFLWKGCIFMMMTVMNLVIVEEKSLGIFQFLVSASEESAHSPCDEENNSKGLLHRKSSTVIVSQFKNIQQVYLTDEVRCVPREVSRLDTLRSAQLRVGKRDSRAFFECLPEYQKNPSEWDDLLDFVECKEGKNYSDWLRKNKKFRKWKHEKRIRKNKLSMKKKEQSISKHEAGRKNSLRNRRP